MHRFHKQSASPSAGRLLWPSLLSIVLCLFCLCGTTLAWFTAAQSAGVAPVTAATFAAKVTVTTAAADGETVLPLNADGSVLLAAGMPYTVTIDASASTASGGYVRFAAVPAAGGQAAAALPAESAVPAQPAEAAQTPGTVQASEAPAELAAEAQNAEPTDETPTTEPAQNVEPANEPAQPTAAQAAAVPQSFVTCRFDSKTTFTFTIIPQQALTLSWQASWGAPTEAGIANGAVLGTLPDVTDDTTPGGDSQPQPDDSNPAQNPSDNEDGSSAPDGSSDSQPDSAPSDASSSDTSSEGASSEDTSSEDTSSSGASGDSSSGDGEGSSEDPSQDPDGQPADASSGEETPAPGAQPAPGTDEGNPSGSASSVSSAPQEESAPAAPPAPESDAQPQP